MKILRVKSYYLVSQKSDLDKEIIKPKIPTGIIANDIKTPRIQLYENIDDALSGGQWIGKDLSGMKLHVYRALGIRKNSLVEPDLSKIPYKLVLKEFWYIDTLRFKREKTKIIEKLKKTMEYRYGPRQSIGKIYKWSWKKELKPWEK